MKGIVNTISQEQGHKVHPMIYVGLPERIKPIALQYIKKSTYEKIIEATRGVTGFSEEALTGNSRKREIVTARYIAIRLLRATSKMNLNKIGSKFNNRDHATIIYALDQAEYRMNHDPEFREKFNLILHKL